MLILMWLHRLEVAENALRLYWPAAIPLHRCRRDNLGPVGFVSLRCSIAALRQLYHFWRKTMWSKPEFTELRFGFEVTMYIANR